MTATIKPEKAPDGIYWSKTLSGDTLLSEKRNGEWHWIDGTGWSEKLEYPEEIVSVEDASNLPDVKPDHDYGPSLTYPLDQFFTASASPASPASSRS